jgi:hypothetical protein
MTSETENRVLEQLKRIQTRLANMELDLSDLKVRTSSIETHQGQSLVLLGSVSQRMDRFDGRLGRIERRLDLVDAG